MSKITEDEKRKGLSEPEWLPNPEDEETDNDMNDSDSQDSDSDIQRRIDEGVKEGLQRERDRIVRRQAAEMKQTQREWRVKSIIHATLEDYLFEQGQVDVLSYSQLAEATRAMDYGLELSESRTAIKEDFKPETIERLRNVKEALIKIENDTREDNKNETAAEIGSYNSSPEDLLTELDEMYTPVIAKLMEIFNNLSLDTPKESANYIARDAQGDLRALLEEMLEIGRVYENEIRMHFAVFKDPGKKIQHSRISDINELAGPSSGNPEGNNTMRLFYKTLGIDEEIDSGLRTEDSATQAEENARLIIELVDTHVKLASGIATTEISRMDYKSESGINPLGKTPVDRLTTVIYLLGSTMHRCGTLKRLKEIIRFMNKTL